MKRIFLAIPIPDHIKDQLFDIYNSDMDINWVKLDNLHVTLAFIGNIDYPTQLELHEELSLIQFSPFSIQFKKLSHFSDRILYSEVDPRLPIKNLHQKITNIIMSLKIPIAHRKFTPHVSLARLKNTPENKIIELIKKNALFTSDLFEINSFSMFSSILSPKGPTYFEEMQYQLIK